MELFKSTNFSSNIDTTKENNNNTGRLLEVYSKYFKDIVLTSDTFLMSNKLCDLCIDKIGRDRFRNYESATNYVCKYTNFNSDRFYDFVSACRGWKELSNLELIIVEYILEGRGIENYFEYFYKTTKCREIETKTVDNIIESILKFDVTGNRYGQFKPFYEVDKFISNLDLGYVSCKERNRYEFQTNALFELYLRPRVGTKLVDSVTGIEHVFKNNNSFCISVEEDKISTSIDKLLDSNLVGWEAKDFSIFDYRSVTSIAIYNNYEPEDKDEDGD